MENVYYVRNILSGRNQNGGLFLFPTDTMASVTLAEQICKSNELRINELQLIKLGKFDDENGVLKAEALGEVIAWDLRRLKEPRLEKQDREETERKIEEMKN